MDVHAIPKDQQCTMATVSAANDTCIPCNSKQTTPTPTASNRNSDRNKKQKKSEIERLTGSRDGTAEGGWRRVDEEGAVM